MEELDVELGLIIAKAFAILGEEEKVEALKRKINLNKTDEKLVNAMILRSKDDPGTSSSLVLFLQSTC